MKEPPSSSKTGNMKRPAAKTKAAAKTKPAEKTKQEKKTKNKEDENGKGEVEVEERPDKRRRKQPEQEQEPAAEPKRRAKRPASKDASTTKPKDGKDKKTKKEKDTAEKDAAPAAEKPKTATWAGRWWPSDDLGSKKFQAIRHVYMEFCAHKLRSQSALASVFFTHVSKSFQKKEIAAEAPLEEFIACAELEVDSFMATDRARCSAYFHFRLSIEIKL